MHHFPFHIGDYLAATSHLSNDEDLAFRRILDMYYHTELPIPLDTKWVAKRLRVSIESIESVLQDMFVMQEDGYHHKRCDEEIAKYQSFIVSGKKGAAVRWSKEKGSETIGVASGEDGEPIGSLSNPNGNREPRTKNREPTTTGTSKTIVAKRDCNRPETVSEQVWQDFQTLRRAKKAPLTSSAISRIEKEAGKAGISLEAALTECCARGWAGFKADWMQGKAEPFDLGAATQRILQRELEKESTNSWESI
jgi:uncharacterized protein YdaU (DUF1376 family)